MSTLAAIRKQIAALEAQAERIARQEMAGAIVKVKELMASYGLTVEHLTGAVATKTRRAAKKAKPAGSGSAKYADPTTGKTWSGFGRAPAWIASSEDRTAFLIDKRGTKTPQSTVKAPTRKRKAAAKTGTPKARALKSTTKKLTAVAKKAKGAAKRRAPAGKPASTPSSKTSAQPKMARKRAPRATKPVESSESSAS